MNRLLELALEYEGDVFADFVQEQIGVEFPGLFETKEAQEFMRMIKSREIYQMDLTEIQRINVGTLTQGWKFAQGVGFDLVEYPNEIPTQLE